MNITLLSLSFSNAFSYSPIMAGNNLMIRKTLFSHSLSSFFLNPKKLNLDFCQFHKIQGSIININEFYSSLIFQKLTLMGEIIDNDGKKEIKNENINQNQKYNIDKTLVIHDCVFHDIYYDNGNDGDSPIQIDGHKPFYMTSCIFKRVTGLKAPLHLFINAATIDHVCMYECESKNDKKYMHVDIEENSFCKIIFSTFAEDNCQNTGAGAFQFQYGYYQLTCNNFSNIKSSDFSIKITDPKCFIFTMSTVTKLNSNDIFEAPIQSSSYLYFTNDNIIDCIYSDSLFFYNQNNLQNDKTFFTNCFFGGNKFNGDTNYQNYFKFNGNGISITIKFDHCMIDPRPSNQNGGTFNYENCDAEDIQFVANLHFVTDECRGTHPVNAYGCAEDQCPDNVNCDKNKFDFTSGEDTYTLIPHTDINTPSRSPTRKFTESSYFSFSDQFSSSAFFSESSDFTYSDVFSDSGKFSRSDFFSSTVGFTKTGEFTRTSDFSYSKDFTNSREFTESFELNRSLYFTPSKTFTKSSYFTKTDGFTKTEYFTKTTYFTKTDDFSKSYGFSKSDGFSKSYGFSKSNGFSESNTLVKIIHQTSPFTASNMFTNSFYFSNSELFILINKQGDGGKISTGALVGIIIGAIAAAAIIIILIIFFIVKKKKEPDLSADVNITETQNSSITVDNTLQNMMENDDPFAEEFN